MYGYAPLGVSYASPLAASIVSPTYAQPVYSYAQPQYIQQSVVQPVYRQPSIRGESRVEYVPYQKPVVEMEDEVRTVRVPKQKWVTDYYPVEYQKEYIPQVRYEKEIEYRPVEKTVQKVDYLEVEREVRRQSFVQPVQYSPLAYSQVTPIQPLQASYVAPTYAYAPQYSYAPTFGYASQYRPYY